MSQVQGGSTSADLAVQMPITIQSTISNSMFFLDLLSHPVLAVYVAMQWKVVGKFFYINTLHFILFLGFYFFFIVGIFYQTDVDAWCNATRNDNANRTFKIALDDEGNFKDDNSSSILTDCLTCPTLFSEFDNGFLICEILLMITTITLSCREIVQFASRKVFKHIYCSSV